MTVEEYNRRIVEVADWVIAQVKRGELADYKIKQRADHMYAELERALGKSYVNGADIVVPKEITR